jgi:CheY-like chemotaxis protein
MPFPRDPSRTALRGRRVLLVEDEPLVATMVAEMLLEAGAAVVGPAYTLDAALELVRLVGLDAAVLDVNLRGAAVWPAADLLAARGVPFLLATGYGRNLDRGTHGAAPVLAKPFSPNALVAAVTGLVPAGSAAPAEDVQAAPV